MPQNAGVQVDTIYRSRGQLRGSGDVASRLLASGFNINSLRTNDILRKQEWLQYDTALLEVARARLNGVAAIMAAGLRFNLADALGVTQLQWEQMSDMTDAQIDMSGVTEGERDRVDFALKQMPIPIIHKDFELNIRLLRASRKIGQTLDTTQVSICTRKVTEQIESLLFNGSSLAVLGDTIPGLLTESNRLTDSETANWNAATGAQIVGDVIDAIGSLQVAANAYYGPYHIFVPYDAWNNMSKDYVTTTSTTITILQRVLQIAGISGVTPVIDIPSGQCVIVQLTSDVVEEVVGMPPTLVQWESHGGMKLHFKVMAIMVPRVRSTKTSQSGIMHLTA